MLLPLLVILLLYVEATQQPPVDNSNPYFLGMMLVGLWLLWGIFTCIKMLIVKNTTEIGVTATVLSKSAASFPCTPAKSPCTISRA